MSTARCPNCGGLVRTDAEWCGQCFTRLRQPSPPPEPAPPRAAPPEPAGEPAEHEPITREERAGHPVVGETVPEAEEAPPPPTPPAPARARAPAGTSESDRVFDVEEGGRVTWTCPSCELSNPIDAAACGRCGTEFSELFRDAEPRPQSSPGRAVALSFLFPGLGHHVLGMTAEGLARGLLFLWTFGTALVVVLVREAAASGTVALLTGLHVAAAGSIYLLTAVDAQRAAEGRSAVVPVRVLFYGVLGVTGVAIAVVIATGFRVTSG